MGKEEYSRATGSWSPLTGMNQNQQEGKEMVNERGAPVYRN